MFDGSTNSGKARSGYHFRAVLYSIAPRADAVFGHHLSDDGPESAFVRIRGNKFRRCKPHASLMMQEDLAMERRRGVSQLTALFFLRRTPSSSPSRYAIRHRGPKRRSQGSSFTIRPKSLPSLIRSPQFPALAFGTGTKWKRTVRHYLTTLVTLLTTCPRASQNTWSRPLKQASSTSTRLPVTYFPITPTGHGFNSQLSVYENEESVGVGLRQSGLARSLVPFSARLTGLTVRKTGTTSTSPRNILGGTYASPSPPA